jgi:beta-glucosidase
MCTAKHFAGYSIPAGGINLGPSSAGEREMRSLYLPPFEMAVKQANVYAVMPSYNEVDGVPAHANKWLLNQVLRKEWNFNGYVFADYGGLSMNCDFHKVAENRPSAALRGITAGVDLEAPRPDVYSHLLKLVKDKKLEESVIDTAVARILSAKFKAGLFEKPLPDTNQIARLIHTPAHQELAKEIASESVILLKNNNNLLPFKLQSIRSLAVIGPNADQVQYGDYSYTRDNKSGVTILQGLRTVTAGQVKLNYAKGCNITGSDTSGFAEAVNAARKSEAVVMVMGETSAVLSGLGWGKGPGENEPADPFTCGEGYDVDDINLPGVQGALIRTVAAEGKPVVLVLVHGRPASIGWEKEHLPAILDAWYPGEQGGIAIAEILFGSVNPSGKLNVSIPKAVGQIPVFYNHKPSGKGYYHQPGTPEKPGRDYVFSAPEPLFPFGFGLSYTSYSYENFKLSADQVGKKDSLVISVDIINTGAMAGKEVVQLYVRDKISSTTTPVKSLKGFKKIQLTPGERQTVSFLIKPNDLGLWDADMKYVTEPGEFEIMIGRSSADILHNATIIYTDK